MYKNKKIFWWIVFTIVLIGSCFLLKASYEKFYKASYPMKYQEYVEKYSKKYKVDKYLVYSVIKCESSFRPNAVSKVGARGLMQIMEETFLWAKQKKGDTSKTSFDDLYDVETNIDYGVFILSEFSKEFKTNENALCAYHAGWGNAKKWLVSEKNSPDGVNVTNIPFNDTKAYVARVSVTLKIYKELYQ
jgi:soluble lytic murein transglycosylase